MAKNGKGRSEKQIHYPSDREKIQKIDHAIKAIENERVLVIAEKHLADDLEFLDVDSFDEALDYFYEFLKEIKKIGPIECFHGRVAERCYEKGFTDIFLFPYVWSSPCLGCGIYLKFGIRTVTSKSGVQTHYCHLDCHEGFIKRSEKAT